MDEVEKLRKMYEELKAKCKQLETELERRERDLSGMERYIQEKEDIRHELEGKVYAYEFALECIGKR